MKKSFQLFVSGILASVAILAVIVLLTGCAGGYGLVKKDDVSVQTIYWQKNDPVLCGGNTGKSGCAFYNEHPCRIVMREDSPDWIVAEEFKHCFGYVHGN